MRHTSQRMDSKLAYTNDIFFGILFGAIIIFFGISDAVLIFSGDLSSYLSYGIFIALVSIVFLNVILSFFSSCPKVLASTQDTSAIILSIICGNIATELIANNQTDFILPTILAVILLSSLLIGLWLYFIGHYKLGNLIRFMPFHILGGFIVGTGLLTIYFSWQVMTGSLFDLHLMADYLQLHYLMKWLPAVFLAFFFVFVFRFTNNFYIMPLVLFLSCCIFFVILYLLDSDVQTVSSLGLLLGPIQQQLSFPLLEIKNTHLISWGTILLHSPDIVALIIRNCSAIIS